MWIIISKKVFRNSSYKLGVGQAFLNLLYWFISECYSGSRADMSCSNTNKSGNRRPSHFCFFLEEQVQWTCNYNKWILSEQLQNQYIPERFEIEVSTVFTLLWSSSRRNNMLKPLLVPLVIKKFTKILVISTFEYKRRYVRQACVSFTSCSTSFILVILYE